MNKDNYEKSDKVLEDAQRFMVFDEEEVEKAREELRDLGVDNINLYPLDTNKAEEKDDDNYYRKSA